MAVVRTEWGHRDFQDAHWRLRIGKMKLTCQTAVGRFWNRVEAQSSGCWEWRGKRDRGYGRFALRTDRFVPAHRFAYELLRGEIPAGLEIDHLCRNRACLNPTHLEAVTHYVNFVRGESPSARVIRTGLCRYGHERAGRRNCPTCNRLGSARYEARQKQMARR